MAESTSVERQDIDSESTKSHPPAKEVHLPEIDKEVLDRICGSIYGGVKGFYPKYFENKAWSAALEHIVLKMTLPLSDLWGECSEFPGRNDFLDWFERFQANLPPTLPRYQVSDTSTNNEPRPDLYLRKVETLKEDAPFDWSNVQLVGDFSQGALPSYQQGLLRLYAHAEEVFLRQPTRIHLHGFYIRGFTMELWVFDRCRLYSCEPFDLRKDPERFITVMAGYAMMNDAELGVNTLIQGDAEESYISLNTVDNGPKRLYLESRPIVSPRTILEPGVTCYRGREPSTENWEYIIKLSWRPEKDKREERFLELVKERGVWGVIKLIEQCDVENMTTMYHGLGFGNPRRLLHPADKKRGTTQSKIDSVSKDSQAAGKVVGSKDHHLGHSFTDNGSEGVIDYSVPLQDRSQKRVNADQKMSVDNKVLSCVVTHPYGRTLANFDNIMEFLEALRDAVRSHRSLYQVGKILHQDISTNNIIIPPFKTHEEPKGMLIDLDAAMDLACPAKQGSITGTKLFMAIDLLRGNPHTYRHDLESFLYVLVVIAVCFVTEDFPQDSRLHQWVSGSWDELAQNKANDMTKNGFHNLISEFSPDFNGLKRLAEDLRNILFPIRGGSIFTGTDNEPQKVDKLYSEMIRAFDIAIASLKRDLKDTVIA